MIRCLWSEPWSDVSAARRNVVDGSFFLPGIQKENDSLTADLDLHPGTEASLDQDPVANLNLLILIAVRKQLASVHSDDRSSVKVPPGQASHAARRSCFNRKVS